MALVVLAVDLELRPRPADDDAGQLVVGGEGGPATSLFATDVHLAAVGGKPAPVRVVARLQRRHLVVLLGAHRLRHERIPAVRADHDAGSLGFGGAARRVAPNAGHRAVLDQDLVDGERLAQLSACGDRGPYEQVVEHDPAWAEGLGHAVCRPRGAGDPDRPEVVRVRRDRRTARGLELLQQPPPLEGRDAGGG